MYRVHLFSIKVNDGHEARTSILCLKLKWSSEVVARVRNTHCLSRFQSSSYTKYSIIKINQMYADYI